MNWSDKLIKNVLVGLALVSSIFFVSAVMGQANIYDPYATQNYDPNAYGLGVNSDAYGRPFNWQQQNGMPVAPIFQNRVRPNAYGPGTGMDQFGRPVKPNYGGNNSIHQRHMNCIGTLKC